MFKNFMNGLVRTMFTGDELNGIDLKSLKNVNAGKVAIVTGGTAGMGRVTTLELARAGYDVTFTGRSVEAGEAITQEARQENLAVTFRRVDYADLSTVLSFATEFTRERGRLDLLVNNAAISRAVHEVTKDGFESVLQINTFGPFYLTKLLLPLLKAAADARIVYVCSDAHWTEKLNFDDMNGLKYRAQFQNEEQAKDHTKPVRLGVYTTFELYSNTKMLNILLARKLLRNLQAEGCQLPVYLLHPGEVATSLTREGAVPGMSVIMNLFFRTPENGARTQIYLSIAPKEKLQPGAYYVSCQPGYCLARCDDEKLQDQAWAKVEEMLAPFQATVEKAQ